MAGDKNIFAPPDTATGRVMVALRRIIRAIDLHSRHLVAKYGLTGPQLALLRELSAHEGVSVGQLAQALHLSQATVTGILDRLAKRDIVRRQQSEQDRRRVKVWLTDTGKQLLIDAPPMLQEQFTKKFGKLEDWEQSQILSALQRVVSMMEAKGIDATPILATGPIAATVQETEEFLDKLQDRQGLPSTSSGSNPTETAAQEESAGV